MNDFSSSALRSNHHKSSQGAFTLIELMVVVSIVTLLLSLLLPALSSARELANQTACASNMRQLLTATHEYLAENDGTFPVNGLEIPHPTLYPPYQGTALGNFWSTQNNWILPNGVLWPEMGGPPLDTANPSQNTIGNQPWNVLIKFRKVFMCPLDDGHRMSGNALTVDGSGNVRVGPQGSGGYWSYSINSVLDSQAGVRQQFGAAGPPWTCPLHESAINNPNFLIFVEESADNSPFNDEVFDPPALNGGDHLTLIHNDGGNVGFYDGHVQWIQEVLFDNVPAGVVSGGTVDLSVAAQSPYTQWFFPDPADLNN